MAISSLLAASAAHAQSPTTKELFDNGQLHFDGGQYDLAIEAWQAAFDQSQRPILLLKLADAREERGEFTAAIEMLVAYREQADDAEFESLDARISGLEAQLATPPVPEPEPDAEPAPEPAPDPVAPAPPAPASLSKGPVVLEGILVGVAAGGLGVGTGFGLRAKHARAEALSFCVDGKGGLVCETGSMDALSRDKSASTAADMGFVVGGIAAALATVNGVLLTQRTSGAQYPKGQIRLVPAPFGVAIKISR